MNYINYDQSNHTPLTGAYNYINQQQVPQSIQHVSNNGVPYNQYGYFNSQNQQQAQSQPQTHLNQQDPNDLRNMATPTAGSVWNDMSRLSSNNNILDNSNLQRGLMQESMTRQGYSMQPVNSNSSSTAGNNNNISIDNRGSGLPYQIQDYNIVSNFNGYSLRENSNSNAINSNILRATPALDNNNNTTMLHTGSQSRIGSFSQQGQALKNNSNINTPTSGTIAPHNNFNNSSNSLILQLQVKQTQLDKLEKEYEYLQEQLNNRRLASNQISKKPFNKIDELSTRHPTTIPEAFRYLTNKLQIKENELAEVNKNLENVLAAVALDPENPLLKDGETDLKKISEKVVIQLETLTKENQELSKNLSYAHSKEKQIELGLLKQENEVLQQQINSLKEEVKC
ncbi:hypothetical protein TBLA_0E02560 [Henningerozyma blattae CBS 6284]|uniref:Uncharacterized protein n=1 Tax=Henningerozyma blattae (strain ATCC 34711 / CBS 6284 / DSM 70876 / NBRC 10599 / NRRL Y-10934 / UCD 77-7) TaxID=1071380 RepID=I2H4L0_HENB6|nr:hypothetical protein TBLA_0E02560 [Tetrapisispora blattae CBS 6284]CCH61312.1 hypothetical protein TBLA_0E02560 [Tetrapisispora blattae CBS 6284]